MHVSALFTHTHTPKHEDNDVVEPTVYCQTDLCSVQRANRLFEYSRGQGQVDSW